MVGTGFVELRATYQNVAGTMGVAVTKAPPPLFALVGVVRDSSTGAPVAGAQLLMVGDYSDRTTTDQAGMYTLRDLPLGRIFVEVTKSGYHLLEISPTIIGDGLQDVSLDPVKP